MSRERRPAGGSWWTDYPCRLAERSGGERLAPTGPGGGGYEPLAAAPGEYVLER